MNCTYAFRGKNGVRAFLFAALAGTIVGINATHCSAAELPKLGGRLSLGANFGGRGKPNVLYETVLKVTMATSPSMRARVEAGADQDDLELKAREAYLEVRAPCAQHRFRAGRDRKELGWHYEQPNSARFGEELDVANAFLAERAFTNRDYFASWDWRSAEDDCGKGGEGEPLHPTDVLTGTPRVRTGLMAVFSQSNDYSLIGHGFFRVGSAWRLGAWALGEARETKDPHQPLLAWVVAASSLYQEGGHRAELEGWIGKDPLASELARERRAPEVLFAAASLRYGLLAGDWFPYAAASYLLQDFSRRSSTLGAAGGLRYYFDPRLSVAAEVRHEVWRGIGHNPDETRGQVLGRYFF